MKCFNHAKTDSIGICKSCGKGLCHKCCSELSNGLACNGLCEDRVNLINKMLDHNKRIISTSNKQLKNTGYFGIIAGLLFVLMGIFFIIYQQLIFGCIFIALGILYVISSILRIQKRSQYPSIDEESQNEE